jgi:DNA-binding transcriptional ArsR family regulator
METKTAVAALAALAQDTRLAIFRLLVERGPAGMPAGAIAGQLAVPAATLSFHLKALEQAGIARSRQEGRFVIYSADFDAMNALVGYLTKNCCGGNTCTPVAGCAPARKRKKEPVS